MYLTSLFQLKIFLQAGSNFGEVNDLDLML